MLSKMVMSHIGDIEVDFYMLIKVVMSRMK